MEDIINPVRRASICPIVLVDQKRYEVERMAIERQAALAPARRLAMWEVERSERKAPRRDGKRAAKPLICPPNGSAAKFISQNKRGGLCA